LALAPDSPSLQLKLASLLSQNGEPDAAERWARHALANLGRDSVVEDIAGRRGEQATEAEILSLLVELVAARERYPETITLAKRLLALEPRAPWGHRSLPVALTFCKRHDEAIEAYGEAIRVFARMDGEYWSVSSLALMFFNRGCERARLGRRAQALADLERAVELDADYAEGAQSDEYFKAYWQDPGFLAIVQPHAAGKRSAAEQARAAHARATAEYESTVDYELSFGEHRWRAGIDERAEYLRRAKKATWVRVRAREGVGALGELDEREDERPTLKRFLSQLRSELAAVASRDAARELIARLVAWLEAEELEFVRGVLWELEGNHNDTTILVRVRRPARRRRTKHDKK
jgi:tetratricopeptide (TPR) repeat protein